MHVGIMYLDKLRQGNLCQRECQELPCLVDALTMWSRVAADPNMVKAMDEIKAANNLPSVETALQEIQKELDRIERDGIGPNSAYQKPKLRLKVPNEIKSPSSFRIKLSASSKFSTLPPILKRRKRSREDLDGITHEDPCDDEWKPTGRSHTKMMSNRQATVLKTNKKNGTNKTKQKKFNARQRLMKCRGMR